MRDFLTSSELNGKIDAFITLHTYSQMWIHPYSHARKSVPADVAELVCVDENNVVICAHAKITVLPLDLQGLTLSSVYLPNVFSATRRKSGCRCSGKHIRNEVQVWHRI